MTTTIEVIDQHGNRYPLAIPASAIPMKGDSITIDNVVFEIKSRAFGSRGDGEWVATLMAVREEQLATDLRVTWP